RHQPSSRRNDDRRRRGDRDVGAVAFLRAFRSGALKPAMGPYDALCGWIDAHHGEQIAFLREIVRVPSDTPPGDNAPAAEKAASLLASLGFAVERHPVPADFLRDYGMQSVTNLIARERFGAGGPVIALNAHGDVVPPGEGWTKPPYDGVVESG